MWPKCTVKPRESHVISKTFLRFMAENGEVMGPRNPEVSAARGAPLVKSWSTEAATTFPGYCAEHEKTFTEFEQDPPRRVATAAHVRLQICRTVASEVQDRRDLAKALNRLHDAYPTRFAELGLAPALDRVKRHLQDGQSFLADLHVDVEHGGVRFGPGDRVAVWATPYPSHLDIAISFLDFVEVGRPDGPETSVAPLAIAVFPQKPAPCNTAETMFIVASPSRPTLDTYIEAQISPDPPLRLLQLAEEWMRRGCFTWWTRPSWWEANEARKRAIEAAALTFP